MIKHIRLFVGACLLLPWFQFAQADSNVPEKSLAGTALSPAQQKRHQAAVDMLSEVESLFQQEKYLQAKELAEKAQSEFENIFRGSKTKNNADAVYNLMVLEGKLGNFKRQQELAEQLKPIIQFYEGTERLIVDRELAAITRQQGDLEGALTTHQQILEAWVQKWHDSKPAWFKSYIRKAKELFDAGSAPVDFGGEIVRFFETLGDVDTAHKLRQKYTDALISKIRDPKKFANIIEEINQELTGFNEKIIQSYSDVGSILLELGRYEEAKATLNKALEVSITVAGSNGIEASVARAALGELYKDLGNYRMAEDYFQQNITNLQVSQAHRPLAGAYQNLAALKAFA